MAAEAASDLGESQVDKLPEARNPATSPPPQVHTPPLPAPDPPTFPSYTYLLMANLMPALVKTFTIELLGCVPGPPTLPFLFVIVDLHFIYQSVTYAW